MGKRKQAVVPARPSSPKKAFVSPAAQQSRFDGIRPSWRFAKLGCGGLVEFAFPDDMETLLYIRGKLAEFETMTIGELLNDRHSNRFAVYNLSNRLIAPVKKCMEENGFEEVYRFRLSGAERVYALSFEHGVFELIWWDPHHKIYPTEKK